MHQGRDEAPERRSGSGSSDAAGAAPSAVAASAASSSAFRRSASRFVRMPFHT